MFKKDKIIGQFYKNSKIKSGELTLLELNFIEIDYKKHFKNIKEFEKILLKTEFNELLGIIE